MTQFFYLETKLFLTCNQDTTFKLNISFTTMTHNFSFIVLQALSIYTAFSYMGGIPDSNNTTYNIISSTVKPTLPKLDFILFQSS